MVAVVLLLQELTWLKHEASEHPRLNVISIISETAIYIKRMVVNGSTMRHLRTVVMKNALKRQEEE